MNVSGEVSLLSGRWRESRKQPKILCLGEPMVEFNQQPDGRYLFGFGGDTSNCAVAAARQGASVGYFTRLGTDKFGDELINLWKTENIDSTHVLRTEDGFTGVCFVSHGPSGHEFSYLRKGSAASRMRPEDLPSEELANAGILHVSAISQAISNSAADTVFAAIDLVGKSGGLVSYDPNLRLKLWPLDRARAISHTTMAKCDIALPSLEDAKDLIGVGDPEKIADYYLDLGAKVVAVKLGSEGVLLAYRDDRIRINGVKVEPVDATGAGDTFDGAFLARLAAGDDPIAAATYANVAAALSTRGYGAISPIPRNTEVMEFLARSSGV